MTLMSDAPRPALGELARLAKAATPGPWKATSAFPIWRTIASLGSTETGAWWVAHDDAYAKHTNGAKADAEFIAACSPAVILQLVALAAGGAAAAELEQARVIALHEAVAPIYFADSSDYLAGLYNVVKVLDAALWMQMEDGATSEHYAATLAAAEAARSLTPERPA